MTLAMWERRPIKLSVANQKQLLSMVIPTLEGLYHSFRGSVYPDVHVKANRIPVLFMKTETMLAGLHQKSTFSKLRRVRL